MNGLRDLFSANLCLRCTGRVFARVGKGLSNLERGGMLLFSHEAFFPTDTTEIPSPENCPVCKGIFEEFDRYYEIVEYELKGYDYETFLMGSLFDEDSVSFEKEIQEKFGNLGEGIKKEFNREFGKFFSDKTGKDVDFDEPDITIVVNTKYDDVKLQIRSTYVKGFYRKMRRDMPQTRWIHGHENEDSVETVIGSILNEMTRGDNYFLHGAGREDVDVRMLGNGREFVIESTNPKNRKVSAAELEERINLSDKGVEVFDLSVCKKESVAEVKNHAYDKTYSALIESDNDIDEEKLKQALDDLSGKVIYQRTPLRVAVRRTDMVREKRIINATLKEVKKNNARIEVTAQSGTYIKEFVHGDKGRTDPSLSSAYGGDLRVAELDVVKIHRGN